MVEIDGVVNEVTPVPFVNTAPPDEAAYQSMVELAAAVADSVTVPEEHTEPFTALVGAAGTVLIVAVTAVLLDEIQPVVVFLACA